MRQSTVSRSGNKRAPWQVTYWVNKKRFRKRFSDKIQEAEFARNLNIENSLPEDFQLGTLDRVAFIRIKDLCSEKNITIDDAYNILKKHTTHRKGPVKEMLITEAYDLFIEDCRKRNLRENSILFYEERIQSFLQRTSFTTFKDITVDSATEYLRNIKSPTHAKSAIRPFLNFCISRNIIEKNPFLKAEIPRVIKSKFLPHVMPVADVKLLLQNIPDEWKPAFALMAFCGIRPGEIVCKNKKGLQVSAIDFKNKRIVIPAEIAKTRTEAVIFPAKNIWTWLLPLQQSKKNQYIAPACYTNYRRIKKRSGVIMKPDVLRHSFGSYGYHFLGAEVTVEIMRHIGGFKTFVNQYKGLASPADSKEYFSITPESLAKESSAKTKSRKS